MNDRQRIRELRVELSELESSIDKSEGKELEELTAAYREAETEYNVLVTKVYGYSAIDLKAQEVLSKRKAQEREREEIMRRVSKALVVSSELDGEQNAI